MVLQYSSIRPLKGFKEYQEIQQTGPLSGLQIHTFVLELIFSPVFSFTEKIRTMKITTLYEPQRKLFWWNWQINLLTREDTVHSEGKDIRNVLLGSRWSVQSSNRQITCFICSANKVYIVESNEMWNSYDEAYQSVMFTLEEEAQKVLHEREGQIRIMAHHVSARPYFLIFLKNNQLADSCKGYKYKIIDLNKYITDPYFYNTRCVGGPNLKTKITTVKKHEAKWRVELEGASKKTATFILDENYEVLDVWGKAVEGPRIWEYIPD